MPSVRIGRNSSICILIVSSTISHIVLGPRDTNDLSVFAACASIPVSVSASDRYSSRRFKYRPTALQLFLWNCAASRVDFVWPVMGTFPRQLSTSSSSPRVRLRFAAKICFHCEIGMVSIFLRSKSKSTIASLVSVVLNA